MLTEKRAQVWLASHPSCRHYSADADQRITPLCALRFCAVTACVCVSIVTRLEACLRGSCMTLMSALFARRRVEYPYEQTTDEQ
jgi:hypothetical protein